jgi:hypothetical protein
MNSLRPLERRRRGLDPTRGMDVCVKVAACDGLIPHPRSPTDCVWDYETEKEARAKERDVDRLTNEWMKQLLNAVSNFIVIIFASEGTQ